MFPQDALTSRQEMRRQHSRQGTLPAHGVSSVEKRRKNGVSTSHQGLTEMIESCCNCCVELIFLRHSTLRLFLTSISVHSCSDYHDSIANVSGI